MNIETVKVQGNGYLLNGSMSVPMADGNAEYELIKQWLSEGNTPEPEFTDDELVEQSVNKLRQERNQRLAELDRPLWYNNLTDDQKVLVNTYYKELLDAPQTGIIPDRLEFIKV